MAKTNNAKKKNNLGKINSNGNTKTQNEMFISNTSSLEQKYNEKTPLETYAIQSLIENISNLSSKIEKLESDNKNINNNLRKIRTKENRLLNRFGWTLIMANILLGVLAFITVASYFQFIYPVLQKNINSEGVFEFIQWSVFGIITFLSSIWLSVMKFAKYVKERDQTSED